MQVPSFESGAKPAKPPGSDYRNRTRDIHTQLENKPRTYVKGRAMRNKHNRKRLICVATAVPLIIGMPVAGATLTASVAHASNLTPQANLNPCPKENGKVNITFWTWEGARRSYNISSTSSTRATRTST